MDWKKIAPWNWFKDEEAAIPVTRLPAAKGEIPDSISLFRTEMDRLFRDFFGSTAPGSAGRALPLLERDLSGPMRPSVDISEGKKAYTIQADLPGVDLDDVALEVEGQTLVIRAERREDREEEGEHYHYVERSRGSIQRVLSLPDDADVEAIDARFKHGVLKLKIPKHPSRASDGRSIEVRAG